MSEEPTDPPFHSSERVVPPTEVDTSVGIKGPWVEVQITADTRGVYDFLWLSPDGAEELADRLGEVAEEVEEQTDD